MSVLKDYLKRTKVVSVLRSHKWKHQSRISLFTEKELREIGSNPEKIHVAISEKMEKFPDKGKILLEELENVLSMAPMSRWGYTKEELKQDILLEYFAYGFTFKEYACYQFANKGNEERCKFLSDRDAAWVCYDINDLRDMHILADKSSTYEHFKEYYGRDLLIVSDQSDYRKFLAFIDKHRRIVKKNAFESCGRSIELIDIEKTECPVYDLFDKWISSGKTIIEELVPQSAALRRLNESSVNTLRCITIRFHNTINAQLFFMKAGRKGAFVDNGAAGGLLIAVNPITGVLGEATDEYGNRFMYHPDNGFKFGGFQLPDWGQAVDLCIEIAKNTKYQNDRVGFSSY